jgi:hypothetical protein
LPILAEVIQVLEGLLAFLLLGIEEITCREVHWGMPLAAQIELGQVANFVNYSVVADSWCTTTENIAHWYNRGLVPHFFFPF